MPPMRILTDASEVGVRIHLAKHHSVRRTDQIICDKCNSHFTSPYQLKNHSKLKCEEVSILYSTSFSYMIERDLTSILQMNITEVWFAQYHTWIPISFCSTNMDVTNVADGSVPLEL